jgi:hypothetical protein
MTYAEIKAMEAAKQTAWHDTCRDAWAKLQAGETSLAEFRRRGYENPHPEPTESMLARQRREQNILRALASPLTQIRVREREYGWSKGPGRGDYDGEWSVPAVRVDGALWTLVEGRIQDIDLESGKVGTWWETHSGSGLPLPPHKRYLRGAYYVVAEDLRALRALDASDFLTHAL